MSMLTNQATHATSPYLRVFADSPIAWQEWNAETLRYAQEHNRPLFVSIGTAEAEVPQLMAQEVFASEAVAEFLNTAFVAVLVDLRQRPDIAHYVTEFSLARSGRVAWPVHAFLTPDLRPMYTFSYIGLEPTQGAPDIIEVLWKMRGYFEENNATLPDFPVEGSNYRERADEPAQTEPRTLPDMLSLISKQYDPEYGGFGTAPKFPPHSPLLFLLNMPDLLKEEETATVVCNTLDAMATRGMWDSTHGGFFTHCSDAAWREAAPEKTLIDQALHLWIYSLAYERFGYERYKQTALELRSCIETQFRSGPLYISALGRGRISGSDSGVHDGSNSSNRDENIITSWNALLGCALIIAARCGVDAGSQEEAARIREEIVSQQVADGRLARSSYQGTVHPHVFLEDYAAMALLDTLLAVPGSDSTALLAEQLELLGSFFYGEGWIHAIVDDFRPVPVKDYDAPHPSPASLAELALVLIRLRLKDAQGAESGRYASPLLELEPLCFGAPLVSDIRNLAAAIEAGYDSPII